VSLFWSVIASVLATVAGLVSVISDRPRYQQPDPIEETRGTLDVLSLYRPDSCVS
jgi:hypothetical protein